jgi:RimK family alpha-L-glutamate ligase
MRFAVIAHRATPTNLALASGLVTGAEPALLTPAQALVHLEPGDVALGRLDVLPSLDGVEPGMWALDELERRGVRVLNRPEAVLAAHDKLRTAEALHAAGLPHPRTVAVADGSGPIHLELPVVVKPPFGSWGHDVYLCATRRELRRRLRELRSHPWLAATGAIVQELVPSLGHDLRLVVAGRRVVGAIERHAPPGEWRTNVSVGGSRRCVEPSPRACELALEATAALGVDLAGVDLLPTGAGEWIVLELNGAVDFTAEYNAREDVFGAAVEALVGRTDALELEAAAVDGLGA